MAEQWYWAMGNPDGSEPYRFKSTSVMTTTRMVQEVINKFTLGNPQCDEITVVEGRIYLHNAREGSWWYFARKE